MQPQCQGIQGQTMFPLDTALLSTVTTSVACPICDAELDLRTIGKDWVYVCGYCGATGTIIIVNKNE